MADSRKRIAKAHGMKFVIPMKEGLQPTEVDEGFKSFIYDEFASRYLESIGVEPTKSNIIMLRERHKITPDELELVPKFKVNGCIRDELQVERAVAPRKLVNPGLPTTDADLFQKVVNAGEDMVPGGPIGNMDAFFMSEEGDEEGGLPPIDNGEVVDQQDIRDPFQPSKQVVQSALADFSSEYPLEKMNRPLTGAQRSEIEKLLQCELMVDLVQTLCHFLHDRVFRIPQLKNKRLLCHADEPNPVPPLSPRTYDATVWRINEAFALLIAPYKRAKPLLSVVGVLVSFTARSVAKRLLCDEFPKWSRGVDGKIFLELADEAIMVQLDPNGYMRQIDLFGDGKTATQPHAPVGSKEWRGVQQRLSRKRRWMHQMYKLSPLMGTLSGSLMTQKSKNIITGANAAHPERARRRGDALDDVSRTKRVGSMASGVRASLPYSQG